jgi:glycosyltransferase involved in cell wall biosynthesis
MAHGLPVVATAVDGVPEAVVTGATGLLVRPADPTDLAEALSVLLADPARRLAFGTAGRERVGARFSRAAMLEGILAVYRDLTV